MRIEFTKDQLKQLLQLSYLGNWLANAHRTGEKDDPRVGKFDKLLSVLLSYAPDAGVPQWVDEKGRTPKPAQTLEDNAEIVQLIEEYDDDAFWEELSLRLAHRDFERLYGICPDEVTLDAEMEEVLHELEERYEREFEAHGLDRLEAMKTIDDILGPEA